MFIYSEIWVLKCILHYLDECIFRKNAVPNRRDAGKFAQDLVFK